MLMMDDIHRSSAAESFRFAIVACNSSTADDGDDGNAGSYSQCEKECRPLITDKKLTTGNNVFIVSVTLDSNLK